MLAGNSVNRREFLNLLRFLGNELRIPLDYKGTSPTRPVGLPPGIKVPRLHC